jgi:hypothetical protein
MLNVLTIVDSGMPTVYATAVISAGALAGRQYTWTLRQIQKLTSASQLLLLLLPVVGMGAESSAKHQLQSRIGSQMQSMAVKCKE